MPTWVMDHDKWEEAVKAVEKDKNKTKAKFSDKEWGLATYIYKKMGGEIAKSFDESEE